MSQLIRRERRPAVQFEWTALATRGIEKRRIELGKSETRRLEIEYRKDPKAFQFYTKVREHAVEYIRDIKVGGVYVRVPDDWELQTHTGQSMDLAEDSEEYARIRDLFKETMPDAEIQIIRRVQNLLQYQKYYASKVAIESECGGQEIEHLLFHGTGNTQPSVIINSMEGLDARMSKNTTLWGDGVYAAEDAKYSNDYACRYMDGTRIMFVVSMLTGYCFDYGTIYQPDFTRNPRDLATDSEFHSVSGITRDSRVYMVRNSNQVVPRYTITYKI